MSLLPSSLKESFFQKYDTLQLAKKLLGCKLHHHTEEGTCSGIIVETEAYLYNDPGCHAFHRRSKRNNDMFLPAGHAYVYQIYGMYHCFNIVSGKAHQGEAVLIRALQPTSGLKLMQKRRQEKSKKSAKHFETTNLCSGPAKLVQAMGIEKNQSGMSLFKGNLTLSPKEKNDFRIFTTTRIGLGKGKGEDLPFRFYIKDNPFISKK